MTPIQIVQAIAAILAIFREVRALLKEGADFVEVNQKLMEFRDDLRKSRKTKDTSALESKLHLDGSDPS